MINVLIVDDSAFFRVNLSQIMKSDSEIKIVATAKDGEDALEKIKKFYPDVITIDFELAKMSGVEVIKKINKNYDIPIIIISSFNQIESETAITTLESGVFDFIEKPEKLDYNELEKIKEIIIKKIKAAYKVGTNKVSFKKQKQENISILFHSTSQKICLVAVSTGGPQTLEKFIPEIPENIPCPILIVQHMPPIFTKSLAERLDKISNIHVVEAEHGQEIKKGFAYIAPGDQHMTLKRINVEKGTKDVIYLNNNEKEEGVRPCANILFRSVAPIYKENTIAIILTGMGYDGTAGSREIKKYNGSIISQSEKTCIIYGMPKSIVDNGLADEVVDINKMAVALAQLIDV